MDATSVSVHVAKAPDRPLSGGRWRNGERILDSEDVIGNSLRRWLQRRQYEFEGESPKFLLI